MVEGKFDTDIVYRNDDSYCGPISMLAKTAGGDILLAFREAKWRGKGTHADPTTRTSTLRSRDGGRSWFSLVTADPAGGNGVAIMQLSDGTVFGNAYHWFFAPMTDQEILASRGPNDPDWIKPQTIGGGLFTFHSLTDGYTWSGFRQVAIPEGWDHIWAHGGVCELPDGELLLPITGRRHKSDTGRGMVIRSRDRGETWSDPICITDDGPEGMDFHETRLLLCPSGRILAMHRTPNGNYWRNVSTDSGRSWSPSEETEIWCGGSSPPDMRLLTDGRVLLSRGYRRKPFGVRCYLSEDEGRTWPREVVLRDDGPGTDVGYPSTAQLDDGQLLTVYYWTANDGIRHLQRTIWDPDI
jgi:hypothetical protein